VRTQLGAEVERFTQDLRPPAPSWDLRLRVRLNARALDSRLADGANPLADPRLALRAQQLTRGKTRARFAATLERIAVLLDATGARSVLQPAALNVDAVRTNRTELLRLAKRLRDDRTVCERGVAMVSMLLRDGGSPLYEHHADLPLSYCTRMALLSLDA
jgi:hypothetical protein